MTPDVPTGYPVLSGETLVVPILAFVTACRTNGAALDNARALQVGAGGVGSAIALAVDVARLKPDTFVGDVITKPVVSPLIAAARRAGWPRRPAPTCSLRSPA